MKFLEFLKKLFTHNVPLKLIAIVFGFLCAVVVQAAFTLL